ncbi:MAG: murein transglycosylase, partial [Mesorhizobium sp.]
MANSYLGRDPGNQESNMAFLAKGKIYAVAA